MIKRKSKIFTFALSLVFAMASLLGCNGGESGTGGGHSSKPAKVELWGKEAYVKVLADREYDDDFRRDFAFDIAACKNEYEGYQLILTATEGRVKSYGIELADLTSEAGETFSKDNFQVYNQKYINVISASNNGSTGLGWYPDALLPFETAVKYGENYVAEDTNQAIYIEAYIPSDTTAGVYTGSFKLTVDGVVHNVPASISVYDYEITPYTHFQSVIPLHPDRITVGEKGITKELLEAYVNAMIDFRIGVNMNYMDATLEEYILRVRHYSDPAKTEHHSLLSTIPVTVSRSGSGINATGFTNQLGILAAASIVDGVDYLALVDFRCGFIDEPHNNGTHALVNSVMAHYNQVRDDYADKIESGEVKESIRTFMNSYMKSDKISDEQFDSGYARMKDTLASSVRLIANFITSYRDSRFTDDVDSFCVSHGYVTTAKAREFYVDLKENNGRDQWWYTVGNSKAAYSKIDAPLLDARIMTWMSYDYRFTGEIYWESALYTKITWDTVGRVNTEIAIDPYAEPVRCATNNGDGYIFYPGKQYGLNKPVTTVRLHGARDGREDYELFYDLDRTYAEHGYSPRAVLSKIFEKLYCDLDLTTDADDLYLGARDTVIKLLMLAKKGVFITDYDEIGATAKATVECLGNVTVSSIGGQAQSAQSKYNVSVELDAADNSLDVVFSNGDSLSLMLGGKTEVIKTLGAAADVKVDNDVSLSVETMDGVTGVGVKLLDSQFGYNSISIAISSQQVSRNTKSVTVRIYNPNSAKLFVSGYVVGSGASGYVTDGVIYPGWNNFKLTNIDVLNWSNIRQTQSLQLMFSFGDYDDNANEAADFEQPLLISYVAVEN